MSLSSWEYSNSPCLVLLSQAIWSGSSFHLRIISHHNTCCILFTWVATLYTLMMAGRLAEHGRTRQAVDEICAEIWMQFRHLTVIWSVSMEPQEMKTNIVWKTGPSRWVQTATADTRIHMQIQTVQVTAVQKTTDCTCNSTNRLLWWGANKNRYGSF